MSIESFEVFKRYVLMGQLVEITTHGGHNKVVGNLLEITNSGLVLQTKECILFVRADDMQDFLINKEDSLNINPVPPLSPSKIQIQEGVAFRDPMSPPITEMSEDLFRLVFSRFTGTAVIPLPEIVFKIEGLTKDDQSELNRLKNKYEYALKVHEFNRIFNILPEMSRLSERMKHPNMFLLCGLMGMKVNHIEESKIQLEKALQLGNRQAAIALANLVSKQGNWEEASIFLIQSFFCNEGQPLEEKEILWAIGNCLVNLENRELPGLSAISDEIVSTEGKDVLTQILSFALKDKHPEAMKAVISGDLLKAKTLAQDSPIYSPPPKLTPFIPELVPNLDSENMKRTFWGHVTLFYPTRGFGFILDNEEKTFFFHITQIQDIFLHQELMSNKSGQKISFVKIKERSIGTKYDMAGNIKLLDTRVKEKGHVVPPTPPNLEARLANLPKDSSIYAEAKRSDLMGDLNKAKQLYERVIIKKEKYYLSAIMDLAQLLSRMGRDEDAISLLDKHRDNFDDTQALDNQKAHYLSKLKRYDEAVKIIEKLQKKAKRSEIPKLARQKAYFIFMAGDLEGALLLLEDIRKNHPLDANTLKMLEMIQQVRLSGISDEQELLGLAGLSTGLNNFAQELIKSCEFIGVDERSKARGYFTKRDFKEVEEQVNTISGRKPRDKARLLVTLAAMAQKSPEAAGKHDPLLLLGRSLSFMGEAATYEHLPKDTARFFLSEALSLITGTRVEFRFPLSYLMATYLPISPAPGELLSDDKSFYDIGKVLRKFEEEFTAWEHFLKDYCYYFPVQSNASDFVISEVKTNFSNLARAIPSKEELDYMRTIELEGQRNERNILNTLANQSYSMASNFQQAANNLVSLQDKIRFSLDKKRIGVLTNIASESASYWNEKDFVERESKYSRIINELKEFSQDIHLRPTKLSFESLLPLANQMKEFLEANFLDYVNKVKPELSLSNVLSNDYYIIDNNGNITLRLELVSNKGGAPVEGLDAIVYEEDDLVLEDPGYSPGILRGGERREIELKIKPSPKQLADQIFTIRCYLRYRTRSGLQEQSNDFSIPIRIGNSKTFTSIINPYKDYAGGRSVEDPNMFKGREELLKRIQEVVNKGPIGQCFVLYGQKRSGKTSVLRQLKRLLHRPCLAIEVTIGAVDIKDGKTNFVQLCLDEIKEHLEDKLNIIVEQWPSKVRVLEEPNESFRRALRYMQKALKNNGWGGPRLVLLIDEFTYLYEFIMDGVLNSAFMKSWKALLQMELFNAVVVGQDSMPKFKEKFPNEFGITYDERISYLSNSEARGLAEDPILLEGKTRFRGYALERLIELTAGSPFYIHILCDRLVNYLNKQQSPFITEGDIERVAVNLTSGPEALPIERFDPLITAAGESVAEASRETYLRTLASIAKRRDGALISELPPIDNLEMLLKDLLNREVIMFDASKRYSIRVGLFAEWLRSNEVLSGIKQEII